MSHSDAPFLEARGIVKRFGSLLANDVSYFAVGAGEVVALLGENGAGKSTLAKILYGFYSADAGEIQLSGKLVTIRSPADARALGIGMVFQNFSLVPALSVFENVALFQNGMPAVVPRAAILERPDDPAAQACIPGLSVRENLALGTGRRYYTGLGMDWQKLDADMRQSFARLKFSPPALSVRAATLSGGNLQRAILARELAHEPKLIVALYPTRGLDARSAATLRALLREARDRGAGVLVVSEDLDELFELSDRLLVLYYGAIAGEFHPENFRAEAVGPLMVGAGEHADAA